MDKPEKPENVKKENGELKDNDSTNDSLGETAHISSDITLQSYFNLLLLQNQNIKIDAPFPKYLAEHELINVYPKTKKEIFKDFEIKDNEGVSCKNDEINKRQSGVFAEIFKQFAKNLFKLGNISLSLPIRVFEPRSMLERFVDWWCFAPILLKKASEQNDFIEAFKLAIVFAISGLFFSTNQLKPFNPLLGETFQGNFEDGTEVYLEHTSHNPCISHYFLQDKNKNYRYSGFLDLSLEGTLKMLATNSTVLIQKGKNTIYLKNTDQTINFQYPKIHVGGMVMGSRVIYWGGHMIFEDRKYNLKANICFAKSHPEIKKKRIHDFYGQIFFHDFSKDIKVNFYEPTLHKDAFPKEKNYKLCEITGSWLEKISFDDKVYWNFTENTPVQLIPEKNNVIPSDARYREDLIWLKRSVLFKEHKNSFEEYAQKWKLLLELQQRHERELREKKQINKKSNLY